MSEISKRSNNSIIKDKFLEENKIIFKRFKPIEKIDRGAFGNIYSVIDLKSYKKYAMKTEKLNTQQKTLEPEAFYLKILQGGKGIPEFITFGKSKNYNLLVETLLGQSLYHLFIKKKRKCHINDVCQIGHQILDRLEWIHSKKLIYRDIKPENFLIGQNNNNIIYVVDFGLCKRYILSKTGKHIPEKMTGKFNGTLIYASPNIVKGIESSRRDDLISLGYMLIYLLKRCLPWESNFQNLNKAKYYQLINLKETNGYNKLFQNIPEELALYINYSRKLEFEQKPNYDYLHFLLNKILTSKNKNPKNIFFASNNLKIILQKKANKKKLQEIKEENNNNNYNFESLNINANTKKINYKKYKNAFDDIQKNGFNFNNNIYSEKIILNNHNNYINFNNDIKLDKFFNRQKMNNIQSERIYLKNNNINLNQTSEIISFAQFGKPYVNRNITPMNDFKANNVISEKINFKNVYLNGIGKVNNNNINFNIKSNMLNKINNLNSITEGKEYYKISNNINYKSPLQYYVNINKKIEYNIGIRNINKMSKINLKKKDNVNLNNYKKTNQSKNGTMIIRPKNILNFNKIMKDLHKDDDEITRKRKYIPIFK